LLLQRHNKNGRLGIPTPDGFIICGDIAGAEHLNSRSLKYLNKLEKRTGKLFGNMSKNQSQLPLLLSIRHGKSNSKG
jgi:hypothetical protein